MWKENKLFYIKHENNILYWLKFMMRLAKHAKLDYNNKN